MPGYWAGFFTGILVTFLFSGTVMAVLLSSSCANPRSD